MEVNLSLELIESLIDGEYSGSVVLLELKSLMETSICCGLVDGRKLSLRQVFEDAWKELIPENDELTR